MSLLRHPLFIGVVSAVTATLITLKVVNTTDESKVVPEGYDDVCQQAEYEMAVGYDNRLVWASRVLCADREKGLGLVSINGYGDLTDDTHLYGVEMMPVHGNFDLPVTFVTTRFGGQPNISIGEGVSRHIPEGCELRGYVEAYFYTEHGWSGAIMTNAKPLVTCGDEARIIGSGNEQTLVRDFEWL